jgi:hypothetical protein
VVPLGYAVDDYQEQYVVVWCGWVGKQKLVELFVVVERMWVAGVGKCEQKGSRE